MIISYGEILVDMIGRHAGDTVAYERHAGGAPFNVACAASRAGGKSGFVGSVGSDIMGRFLCDFAAARGLDLTAITVHDDLNTTLAFVELAEDGERSFCFYRKSVTDARIPDAALRHVEFADTVHIGSLMLSVPEGEAFAARLAAAAHAAGKRVSFDINYREDIFPDPIAAKRAYSAVADVADIVKYSQDEIEMFVGADWKSALEKLARPGKLICVTLGAKGCAYSLGNGVREVRGIRVEPVDTTGAGDAFFGALLSRLDGRDYTVMSDDELVAAFRFACAAGALATTARGAIDSLPSADTIEKALAADTRSAH